jgi:surfactin synthase thioesterase subunit
LLCCSYAGGTSAVYRSWPSFVEPDIEVLAAEYPGRWSRIREPPFESLASIVDSLAQAVAPLLDRPIAMFGYSMGSLVAYELSRKLRADRGIQPLHLFVAAHPAPHLRRRNLLHSLDDKELLAGLADLYGPMPSAIASDPEMCALVLGITRADFRCGDGYHYEEDAPFRCPITAFGGDADPSVTVDELQGWGAHTTGFFASTILAGKHFFINDHSRGIIESVAAALEHASTPKGKLDSMQSACE